MYNFNVFNIFIGNSSFKWNIRFGGKGLWLICIWVIIWYIIILDMLGTIIFIEINNIEIVYIIYNIIILKITIIYVVNIIKYILSLTSSPLFALHKLVGYWWVLKCWFLSGEKSDALFYIMWLMIAVISAARVSPGCGCCSMKGAVVAAISTLFGCHWPIHFWGRPRQGLCELFSADFTAALPSLDAIGHSIFGADHDRVFVKVTVVDFW